MAGASGKTIEGNISHKLPPQSLEAEASLISTLLLDENCYLEISGKVFAHDFYKSRHQIIFETIEALFNRHDPIDLVTVTNLLRDNGRLEEIGGASFLASMVKTIPVATDPAHYARLVHDKGRLRRLIQKANEIVVKCYNDPGPVGEIVDFAQTAVYEATEDANRPAFQPLSDLLSNNFDTLDERSKNRSLFTGIATGFDQLDRLTAGLQNSDLIIIAARPSMGKTAFALNVARNAALDHQVPTAIFSLEMAMEQLSMRMLASEARVSSNSVRTGFLSNEDMAALREAADQLSRAPIYIDDSPDISVTEIRAKARRLKMSDSGLGLIIIDYLQLMRTNVNAERRDLAISEISRSLKILAKELNLPVVTLSQLNRKLEERHDKRPQLADLRESGALEQDADVVAFIYRDEVYHPEGEDNKNKADLLLKKQRNGPTGVVPLTFLGEYTRFENAADDRYDAAYLAP